MPPDDRPDDAGTPEPDAGAGVEPGEIPWGQRLYDRPFVLLILGLAIMLICFTGWGLWEISKLTPAPLP